MPDSAGRPVLSQRGWTVLFIAAALVVPLAYVLITHHVWEDFFITFRHSRNFVEGKGLVFNPGERVQGFTSAINVMLPALCYWITGENGYLAALNLYRGVSLLAYLTGGLVVLRLMLRAGGPDRWAPLLFILLYVTEPKTVAFSVNGQECGFMVCFMSLGFAAAYLGMARFWWLSALAWTGLLYTRPDSPVYVAVLAVSGLIFAIEPRRQVLLGILKAGAVAGLIFLPWFISMWVYYGQPLPHTVVAKSKFQLLYFWDVTGLVKRIVWNYPMISGWVFGPIYTTMSGWPAWLLQPVAMVCKVICTFYWLIPSRDRLARMASLVFMLGVLYLSFVQVGGFVSSWYLPTVALFSTIVLSRGIGQIAHQIRTYKPAPLVIGRALQIGIVTVSILLMAGTTLQIYIQQREIEDNQRMQIGLWLRDHVADNERVYLEPLGYIGYFSDRHMVDWPGLVAPQVVKIRRQELFGQYGVPVRLKPEWMVMRPKEWMLGERLKALRENYTIEKTFDARPRLDQYRYIPGRGYLDFDSVFYILRRTVQIPNDQAPMTNQ